MIPKTPSPIIERISHLASNALFYVKTKKPMVALTIDDSPSNNGTQLILDTLEQYDAKATFFIITSYLEKQKQVIRDLLEEGHEIGNHLVSNTANILLSPSRFKQDLRKSHETLSQYAEMKWFRPGSGWYSKKMLRAIEEYNYNIVLGSVYPFDPQLPFASYIKNHILRNVFPGAIIILHDHGSRGPRTARILQEVLPALKNEGYTVGTVSELVANCD